MDKAEFARTESVSRETLMRLQMLAELVVHWNRSIGLIGRSTEADIWRRHIQDSIQILDHIPAGAKRVLDIGTGGGFPGLAVAIAAADRMPGTQFLLVESNERKCEFLREVCRRTEIVAKVICNRVEVLAPQNADVVTARALEELDGLLGHASRHLAAGGICLFHKSERFMEEIMAAMPGWRFSYAAKPSRSDKRGRILEIRNLSHA